VVSLSLIVEGNRDGIEFQSRPGFQFSILDLGLSQILSHRGDLSIVGARVCHVKLRRLELLYPKLLLLDHLIRIVTARSLSKEQGKVYLYPHQHCGTGTYVLGFFQKSLHPLHVLPGFCCTVLRAPDAISQLLAPGEQSNATA
jgi:hypothetical protein